jgi:hypothetical protein
MFAKLAAAGAALMMATGMGAAQRDARPARPPDGVAAALEAMIHEEYRTEAGYRRTLAAFGSVEPFARLVDEEDLHSELVAALIRWKGMEVPEAAAPEFERRHASLADACAAAAEAERAKAQRYERWLAGELPARVRRVFEHNRREAEAVNAPAFERCAGRRAGRE